MRRLLHGIRTFQNNVFPVHRDRFESLADGQRPSTLLITCSDSRIVPHLLTQTAPGDLFVIRNAGNLVPPYDPADAGGEAATIEYAVQVLKVRDIIVCGHSRCGAISGLLDPESTASLPAVRSWLKHAESTRRAMAQDTVEPTTDDQLTAAVRHNVRVQLEHLRSYPFVDEKEACGELALAGWVYRFETGEVFVLDESDRFVNIAELADLKQSIA